MKKPSELYNELRASQGSGVSDVATILRVLDEQAELERKRFAFLLALDAGNRGLMFQKQVSEQLEIYKAWSEKEGLL